MGPRLNGDAGLPALPAAVSAGRVPTFSVDDVGRVSLHPDEAEG